MVAASLVRALCALAAVAGTGAHAAAADIASSRSSGNHGRANVVKGSYIIQTDSSAGPGKANVDAIAAPVVARIKGKGLGVKTRQTFEQQPQIFTGFSLDISGDDDFTQEDLQELLDAGMRAYPVHAVQLPTNKGDVAGSGKTSASDLLAGGVVVANDTESTTRSKRFTINPADYANDQFGIHQAASVDKLHNSGILGAGVKVAVIDSGVDYTNPILGGCYGSGCHISFGYDLVGDDYTGGNTPVPDDDPFADCSEHGTHVTGIIGALQNSYDFSGVAPAAELGHYRIYGCSGGSTEDLVLQALIRAVTDGSNVVSISLSTDGGWLGGSALDIAVDNAASFGVFVSIAQSNVREEGPFKVTSPGTTLNQATVGSSNPKNIPAYNAFLTGYGNIPVLSAKPLAAMIGQSPSIWSLYFTSTDPDTTDDACSPLPDTTPDLTNKVTIVQRGACYFQDKFDNIAAKGGRVVLVYNNAEGLSSTSEMPYIAKEGTGLLAVGSLRREDGLTILSRYTARSSMQFSNGPLVHNVAEPRTPGLISYFSSWGPSNDLFFQPTFVAPGNNVLSTYPLTSGGLAVLGGTSGSTPFTAGAAALVWNARSSQNLDSVQVRNLLSVTTEKVPAALNTPSTYISLALQGSGNINVTRATQAAGIPSVGHFALNDTEYFQGTQTFDIYNSGPDQLVYTFRHTPAQTIATFAAPGDITVAPEPPVLSGVTAGVTTPRSVIIPSGETRTVTFTFTHPSVSADVASQYPIYSGWIDLIATSRNARTNLQIPYMGMANRMFDASVLDTSTLIYGIPLPLVYNNAVDEIQYGPATYTFATRGPQAFFRLALGTRVISLDVVYANIDLEPTIPNQYTASSGRMSRLAKRDPTTRQRYSDVPIIGTVYSDVTVGRDYLYSGPYGYSDFEIYFDGQYTAPDGSTGTVATGVELKLLVRALKVFGDATYEDQYESWLSPSFTFTS